MKSVRIILGVAAAVALFGAAKASADYYPGGCEQNYRGQVICSGDEVRDVNTGSVGTVIALYGYNDTEVRFDRGYYAGRILTMTVDALEPWGYAPNPNPYPGPNPYPPQPYPGPHPYPPQPYPGPHPYPPQPYPGPHPYPPQPYPPHPYPPGPGPQPHPHPHPHP